MSLHTVEGSARSIVNANRCLGAVGYINKSRARRLLRDAKLYEIGAGTSEIRRWLIGREILRRRCDCICHCGCIVSH